MVSTVPAISIRAASSRSQATSPRRAARHTANLLSPCISHLLVVSALSVLGVLRLSREKRRPGRSAAPSRANYYLIVEGERTPKRAGRTHPATSPRMKTFETERH